MMLYGGTPVDLVQNRIREHGAKHKIEELCLDEIPIYRFTLDITTLLDKCLHLQYVSLCDCHLQSLSGLPSLPQLQILELMHNELLSQHLEPISKYTKLYSLSLNFNRIEDLNWTRFLKRNRISVLSLKGNPVTLTVDYRQKTYRALGADLQQLDGVDRIGNTILDSVSSESVEDQAEQSIKQEQSEVKQQQNQSSPEQSDSSSSQSQSDEVDGQPSKKWKQQEYDDQYQ